MKRFHPLKAALLMAILVLFPIAGCAAGDDANNNRRQGPPPEAISACAGKQAGDSVEFTGRRGETVKATCREMNGQLAAVPAGGPPEGNCN
ncbi:hypothetical protein FCL47_16315 [Desulfopila sp. IMCC35006]|uniref:hypothetical protein n=1 Tax=Desulfopila sp. IMCC35006 TaxID=2569542 RepID=UPI0010ABD8FC|nr:hypothetical protein [Desulfopila sp. IMCC35006]TKB24806.1 hypothetical protein FCL47_16315 [Desulfopila sp. IMCC35006]